VWPMGGCFGNVKLGAWLLDVQMVLDLLNQVTGAGRAQGSALAAVVRCLPASRLVSAVDLGKGALDRRQGFGAQEGTAIYLARCDFR
jgi:hypothetical protein